MVFGEWKFWNIAEKQILEDNKLITTKFVGLSENPGKVTVIYNFFDCIKTLKQDNKLRKLPFQLHEM